MAAVVRRRHEGENTAEEDEESDTGVDVKADLLDTQNSFSEKHDGVVFHKTSILSFSKNQFLLRWFYPLLPNMFLGC